MAEVELGDGEDSEDGESEEEAGLEGEQMEQMEQMERMEHNPHMVMMNEDSMDVARMQSNFHPSEVHAGTTVMRFH